MSSLHDLDNSEAIERYHGQLDMEAVAAAAMRPKMRRWRVEFDCNGEPFNWEGEALTAGLADASARAALWGCYPTDFLPADARTVVCVEVPA